MAQTQIETPIVKCEETASTIDGDAPMDAVVIETVPEVKEKKQRKRRAKTDEPRKVSVKKQAAIRDNYKVSAWQAAAKSFGYIKPGGFEKLPKRGTPEHLEIKAAQLKFEEEWAALGEIPEIHRLKKPAPVVVGDDVIVPLKKKRARKSTKKDTIVEAPVDTESKVVPSETVPAPVPVVEKEKCKRVRKPRAPKVPKADVVEATVTSENPIKKEKKPRKPRAKKQKVEDPVPVLDAVPVV